MKCVVCGKPALKNSIVCSDHCQRVRLRLFKLGDKYFPTNGCENCWGDLHQGCTDECKEEFRKSGEFMGDLWSLVKLILPSKKKNSKETK